MSTNPQVTIIDCATGQVIEREMTAKEASDHQAAQLANLTTRQAQNATVQSRQDAIAALKAQAATDPLVAQIVAAMGW